MKSMTLLVIASVLSFAAHADPKTNCDAKIQELEDFHKASGQAMHGGMAHDFKVKMEEAKTARDKGDMTKCQSAADQAKTIYNKARSK
ncbi:hypothetical protein HP546_17475 [Pseudomonas sp. CM25]|uniref:hypothetical protein n=1 Tax=unclassified Pseudomonas TaxID=196821 RepID=UPI00155602E9|nr:MULTISPECIES: hypothetical protein [unclassified Pseudomonas]NQD57137.1 hypothetical protein [Pseudomonas sp. CM25]NQD73068.1 hypothetical protein [Pseudomonas sp. CM27]HEN8798308.1 hypothetical protein [Pseudomonas putida]